MTALLLALFACAASSEAPPAPPAPPTPAAESPERPVMPGSYRPGEVNDEARAAADFALAQLNRPGATLMSVDAVETQVVAGLNHRLDVTLSDGSRWRVVVYRNLEQQQLLTSQEPLPAK